MATLQIQDIALAYADRDLLKGISFTIDSKTRAALAGENGSGKSTLMKIICSQISSDSGSFVVTKGTRISYLPQSDIVLGHQSLFHEVETGYARYIPLLREIKSLENELAKSDENTNTEPLLHRLHEIQETMLASTYWQREAVIEQILVGLGFDRTDFVRQCNEFSGGWQMRIALAKILVEDPDIMLLDEPTNYLDIEARTWLKHYLRQYDGGLLIVSHDQGFMDETVNEVYELFNGQLTRYAGNYSSYLLQREQELQRLEASYRHQMEMIEKTEQFIERFRYKATKARQVQSREKQLNKIELVEVPSHLKKLSFRFPPAPHSGNDAVVIDRLSKQYGSLRVFENFSLIVNKKDRLAVTGRNGAGKSTLLRMIAMQDHDYSGSIQLGANVKIGYFAQDTEHTMDMTNTVYSELETVATTSDIPRLRSMLGSFLFSDDDVYKSISVLSGGERSRLALLKILIQPANLLILDEPTNHLDINAKQMLLDALKAYDGSILFVSHDSHFIKNLATRILYLHDGEEPEIFEGDYDYFSWKLEQKEQFERIRAVQSGQDKTQGTPSDSAISRKESNRLKNRLRNLRAEADTLLKHSEELELKLETIEHEMARKENYSDGERIVQLVQLKELTESQHEEITQQWFSLHEEIEQLEHGDAF